MLSQFSLTGKRALVTGSSRGIGLAIAGALSEAGAEIVLNGRDPEALGKAAETLASQGAKVKAVAFDVTSAESVSDGIAYCEEELGGLDILVNNAGQQHRAPLEEFPRDAFEALMATHVTSTFTVSQAAAKGMIVRRNGRIINICSVLTDHARAGVAPYGAAKAAIANLTRGMAADWAKYGINANAIAPGFFKTELNTALFNDAEFSAWLEKRTPMGRWGEVEELGGAAVFLASNAASFVNGHILYVDGAFTAVV
ncbi:SDR family oxidoreductase [Devosia nitrariae]|uniref:SDR family oxidoreductase n=1 Tax=Devosia nitrariae TaxID=2071872 RepID=UPI0024E14D30|nr:SDR family oxidoreductase [Devosia nitrariae]